MCLLAFKPRGVELQPEHYREAFAYNDDGAGFAAATGNMGLVVSKGYFNFDSFWEEIQRFKACDMVIHFRLTTHGLTNSKNCHPFDVGAVHGRKEYAGRMVMGHNGVISGLKMNVPQMSDTWHFVRDHAYPMWKADPKFHTRKDLLEGLGKAIGFNKLVFMDADGTPGIVNEHLGHWESGHWYSNESYARSSYYGYGYSGNYGACAMTGSTLDKWTEDVRYDGRHLHNWEPCKCCQSVYTENGETCEDCIAWYERTSKIGQTVQSDPFEDDLSLETLDRVFQELEELGADADEIERAWADGAPGLLRLKEALALSPVS